MAQIRIPVEQRLPVLATLITGFSADVVTVATDLPAEASIAVAATLLVTAHQRRGLFDLGMSPRQVGQDSTVVDHLQDAFAHPTMQVPLKPEVPGAPLFRNHLDDAVPGSGSVRQVEAVGMWTLSFASDCTASFLRSD